MQYKLKTPKFIEKTVVRAYKAIEHGAVGAYKKVENAFVSTFLEKTEKTDAEPTQTQTQR